MDKALSVGLSALIVCLGFPAAGRAAEEAKPKVITNSIGMKLVLIPAGEFMMGSRELAEQVAAAFNEDDEMAEFFEDEHPRHRVRITKPFYLSAHEVTVGQFRQFVKAAGYKKDVERGTKGAFGWNPDKRRFEFNEKYSWRDVGFEQTDDHPVVNVSWNDAVAFCDWLSRKEAKTYRLPTEAEWEYACRAGTTTRYWHGDDPEGLTRVGNVMDGTAKEKYSDWDWGISARDGFVFTSPAGSFKANPFGLYDMHGNVWEWCADWYDEEYYATYPADDPAGPSSGTSRVLRGGSWFNGPGNVRSTNRFSSSPVVRNYLYGFRVARTP